MWGRALTAKRELLVSRASSEAVSVVPLLFFKLRGTGAGRPLSQAGISLDDPLFPLTHFLRCEAFG